MTTTRRRVVVAFVVAPMVTPIMFSAELLAARAADRPPTADFVVGFLAGLGMVCLFSLPVAYLAELLLGAPLWVIFRHYGIHLLAAFALGGALIGCVVALVLQPAGRPLDPLFGPLCILAASGSLVAFRAIVFGCHRAQRASEKVPSAG